MFHATGLTGWQRAAADSQSSDDPATPPSESAVANQVDRAEQEEVAVLKQQASEILRSLQNIQDRLAKLESSSERDRPSESTESAVE